MPKSRNSIFFVGLLSAFSLLTFDLYQPSLPHIVHLFGTTPSLGQLTLSIYLFIFGVSQLFWGPLIDHFGRRRLLPGSLLVALIASLICVFATNISVLIFGRALQGFALCCAHLVSYSTSRDFEDSSERAKILSYISMIVSISPILAPVVGSMIFTYFGWQYNFALMALIALILWMQSRQSLIESPFWHEPKAAFKMEDVLKSYKQVLPTPILWYGSMIMMFSFLAVMLTVINSSYLIINILGYSPLVYGLIFILNGLNIIFGNYVGIGVRQYMSMPLTIYVGNGLIIIGGLGMLIGSTWYGFSLYTLSFALIANLGISVSAPSTMSITLTDFKENTGTALAIINSIRMLGSSIGSFLVGYLLVQNINALPIGLIFSGIGALYCSWQFNRIASGPDASELDGLEAAG